MKTLSDITRKTLQNYGAEIIETECRGQPVIVIALASVQLRIVVGRVEDGTWQQDWNQVRIGGDGYGYASAAAAIVAAVRAADIVGHMVGIQRYHAPGAFADARYWTRMREAA